MEFKFGERYSSQRVLDLLPEGTRIRAEVAHNGIIGGFDNYEKAFGRWHKDGDRVSMYGGVDPMYVRDWNVIPPKRNPPREIGYVIGRHGTDEKKGEGFAYALKHGRIYMTTDGAIKAREDARKRFNDDSISVVIYGFDLYIDREATYDWWIA